MKYITVEGILNSKWKTSRKSLKNRKREKRARKRKLHERWVKALRELPQGHTWRYSGTLRRGYYFRKINNLVEMYATDHPFDDNKFKDFVFVTKDGREISLQGELARYGRVSKVITPLPDD